MSKFGAVNFSFKRKALIARLVGVFLSLAIFALPLHSHADVSAKSSKECSCYQGSRTQLGLLSGDPVVTPNFYVSFISVEHHPTFTGVRPKLRDVRAPPSFLSR